MEIKQDEPLATCRCCEKRPATTRYQSQRSKFNELACDSCADFLDLKEGFEWGIYDSRPLAHEEKWDELLAWIETFDKANRHRDQNGWLAKAVAGYRELTLWEAGRYEEALEACNVIEKLGFNNVTDRWSLAGARARIYEDMERHAEALTVFEEAFREQDPRYISGAGYWMRPLVEFSANAGKPVDERWREVVQNVADEFAVEFPERPTLGESILALFELIQGKPSKRQREHGASG